MYKHIGIIGGTSGIGLSLTKILNNQGDRVSVFSRNRPAVLPDSVNHYVMDATSNSIALPESIDETIDGLVYCPGSITLKPFNSLKIEDYQQDFDLNVLGALRMTKIFLPLLKKGNDPSILLFSTVAVQTGLPYHTSVSASKGAIEGITRSLSAELAPKIRVNCIAPSLTNTPLAAKLLSNDRQKEKAQERHPLNKYGEPKDIAEMAAFLISSKANFITGQVIQIDGGLSTIKY